MLQLLNVQNIRAGNAGQILVFPGTHAVSEYGGNLSRIRSNLASAML
jgi:hypothetical protein